MTEAENKRPKVIGRTWADIFSNGFTWIALILVVFVLGYFGVFKSLTSIPIWVYYSIGMSLIFIPFLLQRARDDANLVLVIDDHQKLTEYRIGKRYNWTLDGNPVYFTSNSGVKRLLVTKLDLTNGRATSTALAGFTQFDLARDLSVFNKLSNAFSEHLKKERITKESIAVEVEKRVNEISNKYLSILYGSLDPTELENALNINNISTSDIDLDIEEVINVE